MNGLAQTGTLPEGGAALDAIPTASTTTALGRMADSKLGGPGGTLRAPPETVCPIYKAVRGPRHQAEVIAPVVACSGSGC
jgi:hypothetical protein